MRLPDTDPDHVTPEEREMMANEVEVPTWLETPPVGKVNPPTVTRKQDLPFGDLSWEDFERLCLRLARYEANVEHCQLYGKPGSKQEGIDLFARTSSSSKYRVYQCKRQASFGPAKIQTAVEKFVAGKWIEKTDVFVLCTKEDLRNTDRIDAFESLAKFLKEEHEVSFLRWDAHQLNLELKNHPKLVDDFFGRAWAIEFYGQEASELLSYRLDAQKVAEFRSKLGTFYHHVFNVHDPGLPHGELSDRAMLAIERRFVVPDVIEQRSVEFDYPSESIDTPSLREEDFDRSSDTRAIGDPSRSSRRPSPGRLLAERVSVDQWLESSSKNVILGRPGSGKSTLLRFLAIDLFRASPELKNVARKWGRHLPVWVPFAHWTKLISQQASPTPSLTDVMRLWLQSFDQVDLWPLVERALGDERLLLLVDGLDEWDSEGSAGIAFNALRVFVEQHDVPVVMTTRPRGYEKLGIPADSWHVGELAVFSSEQQKELVQVWFAHWHHAERGDDSKSGAIEERRIARDAKAFIEELQRSGDLAELAANPLLLLLLIYHRLQRLALPSHRFKAYESMVEHLVATHPQKRRIAASVSDGASDLTHEDFTKALANIAFHIQSCDAGGVLDKGEAVKLFEDFLKDEERGLGLSHAKARRIGHLLMNVGEGDIGLLVKRSSREIGFFHRTFQEFLAALHLLPPEFSAACRFVFVEHT
jgi:energy-coupling factor transporter ATP-binding protein EcfA2